MKWLMVASIIYPMILWQSSSLRIFEAFNYYMNSLQSDYPGNETHEG
jgi:hypothetical protein